MHRRRCSWCQPAGVYLRVLWPFINSCISTISLKPSRQALRACQAGLRGHPLVHLPAACRACALARRHRPPPAAACCRQHRHCSAHAPLTGCRLGGVAGLLRRAAAHGSSSAGGAEALADQLPARRPCGFCRQRCSPLAGTRGADALPAAPPLSRLQLLEAGPGDPAQHCSSAGCHCRSLQCSTAG